MGKRVGSKGKYHEWITEEGLLKIEGWARDGLTDEQIAKNIGIAVSTLNNWKNKYAEFMESLKKGKEVIDRQVENALLKRALGYIYTEIKTEDDGYEQKKTKTIKEVAPDTTAQIFWLRNRMGEKWRNKEQVDVSKILAETEYIKQKTALIKGIEKDTGLLDALIEGRKLYEQNKD